MALQEPACPDRWWELFRCGELIGSGRMRRGVQENARCLSSYGKVVRGIMPTASVIAI